MQIAPAQRRAGLSARPGMRFDRYEKRAPSRRKFAMRAFDEVALPAAARAHFGRTNLDGKSQ
jgi:hypothetical protein